VDITMSRLRWHIAQHLHHLNYRWMTVAFFILLSLVLVEFGIKPRQAASDQLQSDIAQLSLQLTRLQHTEKRQKITSPDELTLPALQQLNGNVIRLHAMARQAGIGLSKMSYQLSQEGKTHWRYSITFDGNLAYPSVRKFLDTAFRQQPNLSLDKLEIRREDVLSGQPHVQLQLSLYFAMQPTGGAS